MTVPVSNACSPRRRGTIDDEESQPDNSNATTTPLDAKVKVRSLDIEGQTSFVPKMSSTLPPRIDALIAKIRLPSQTGATPPLSSSDSYLPSTALRSLLGSTPSFASSQRVSSTARETTNQALELLTKQGIRLSESLEKAHIHSKEQLLNAIQGYLQYTQARSSEPHYKTLYDEAKASVPRLLTQWTARQAQEKLDETQRLLGQLAIEETTRHMQVRLPIGLHGPLMASEIGAHFTEQLLFAFPLVDSTLMASEAITGKNHGGLGLESLSTEHRIIQGVLALVSLIPYANALGALGSKTGQVVAQTAQRTGRTVGEIEQTLGNLRAMKLDANVLLRAVEKRNAHLALAVEEEAMLNRAIIATTKGKVTQATEVLSVKSSREMITNADSISKLKPHTVITTSQSIERGFLKPEGKLTHVLVEIENEFMRHSPKNALSALSVIQQATSKVGLEAGFASLSKSGEIILENVGGITTTLHANGSIVIERGSQVLLHLVP